MQSLCKNPLVLGAKLCDAVDNEHHSLQERSMSRSVWEKCSRPQVTPANSPSTETRLKGEVELLFLHLSEGVFPSWILILALELFT